MATHDKAARAGVAGALGGAFLASACCLGPLLFAALGIGGAGLLIKLEPYRPLFGTVTLGLLGVGFWFTYRPPKVEEGDDCGCEVPKANKAGRIGLWIATAVVILLLLSPNLIAVLA